MAAASSLLTQPCHVKATFAFSHPSLGLILVISHVKGFTLKCVWACADWGQATKMKCHRWKEKKQKNTDGQICCGAKVLFIFSLNKRKNRAVLIWFSAWCQTGVSSALQWLYVNTWERPRVCYVLLCYWLYETCVCESEGVCVVVTGQWCACSDCILWPSALNK